MTHADELARLRDAVVEAAREFVSDQDADSDLVALEQAVDALIAAEALTCPACKGHGRISMQPGPGARGVLFGVCPACNGTGRATSVAGPSGPEKPDKEEADG